MNGFDLVSDPVAISVPRPGWARCESNRRKPALPRWPPASDGPPLRHLSRHGGDLRGANRFWWSGGPPITD